MDGGLDPDKAAYLSLHRQKLRVDARDDFLAYYQLMTGFRAPHHIRIMARLLQNMEKDIVDRAMVFAPAAACEDDDVQPSISVLDHRPPRQHCAHAGRAHTAFCRQDRPQGSEPRDQSELPV